MMGARTHARMQVDHVMMQGGGDLSNILYVPGGGGPPDLVGCGFPRFENLRFDDDPAGQYGGQVTPDSILEDPMLQHGGSSSGGSSARNARRGDGVPTRKKKSGGGGGGGFFPQIVLSLGNRRKGAPHRAPLA
jgi:hypothetical protein